MRTAVRLNVRLKNFKVTLQNRRRLHIHVNLTWYAFLGDGIAQALFSTFKLIAKLESSCRPNWKETIEAESRKTVGQWSYRISQTVQSSVFLQNSADCDTVIDGGRLLLVHIAATQSNIFLQ